MAGLMIGHRLAGLRRRGPRNTIQLLNRLVRTYRSELLAAAFALSTIMLYAFLHILGTDESDNFLAAQSMLSGDLPYRDFFSHHMPGAYLISCAFYLLSFGNPLAFRLLFAAAIFAWLIYNFSLLRRYANRQAAFSYLLLASLVYGLSLQYQLLAESIIAFAISTIIIWLLLLGPKQIMQTRRLSALSILLFIIPFAALSYIYVALLLYVLAFIRLDYFRTRTIRTLAILAAPYLVFGLYLVASGSLRDFIFQNLTFNATYYSVFLDSPGANPLTTALDIASGSLAQIGAVLAHPIRNLDSLALLLGFLALPVALFLKGWRLAAAVLLVLLLFANSRVSLYGTPAIENFAAVTHHAGVYRTLAIVCFSLAIYFAGPAIKKLPLPRQPYAKGATAALLVVLAGSFLWAHYQTYATSPAAGLAAYRQLPDPSIRIINTVATSDQYAWAGPISFLSQSYLVPKIATEYTFFMPWHQACPDCRTSFYAQLSAQKPVAIEWRAFGGIPAHPLPSYSQDMAGFLRRDYFQLKSDQPGFDDLYFHKDHRQEITGKLRAAGYTVR